MVAQLDSHEPSAGRRGFPVYTVRCQPCSCEPKGYVPSPTLTTGRASAMIRCNVVCWEMRDSRLVRLVWKCPLQTCQLGSRTPSPGLRPNLEAVTRTSMAANYIVQHERRYLALWLSASRSATIRDSTALWMSFAIRDTRADLACPAARRQCSVSRPQVKSRPS